MVMPRISSISTNSRSAKISPPPLALCDIPSVKTRAVCKGGHDVQIRPRGGLVKTTAHLFAIDRYCRRISSPSCKIRAKLVEKGMKARWLHKAEEPRICVMAGNAVRQFEKLAQEIFPSFCPKSSISTAVSPPPQRTQKADRHKITELVTRGVAATRIIHVIEIAGQCGHLETPSSVGASRIQFSIAVKL